MLKNIFTHNWWAILYFNFKMLPLKQAIFLPFDFYGKIKFESLSGTVKLYTSNLKFGIIKIGSQGRDMFANSETVLSLNGKVHIEGRLVIGVGTSIICKKNAHLHFGLNTILGARNIVYCEECIKCKENFLTSWDCQIMDSDTHPVYDLITGETKSYTKPIIFGNHVWLGNGVIINKGTTIPDNTIVASRSLCNKDYTQEGNFCIIAGTPAKVVSRNKTWEI